MISKELERCLNAAISEANRRGHEYVTVEHILYSLLSDDSICIIIEGLGGSVDVTRDDLEKFFNEKLEKIEKIGEDDEKSEHNAKPTLSFQRVLQRAAQSVLSSGKTTIQSDSILVSIFSEQDSFACFFLEKQNITRFSAINYISHNDNYTGELLSSTEKKEKSKSSGSKQKAKEKSEALLSQFTQNLCEKARQGLIDPVVGRQSEIERMTQILCRRRKNNPLLVGEAGVGKTTIVEGLAQDIVDGKVPHFLQNAEIFSLDLTSLLAGTKFRGDFEARIKGMIKELEQRPKPILFIDEIHTIIGAGASGSGSMDASNILKPILSEGKVRCVGSTTFKEFRQFFENEHAMARRFQNINIEEPSKEDTLKILKTIKPYYEKFHNVSYSQEALKGAVDLAVKYMRDRKLPDKAVDIIDEVGAAFALRNKTEKRRSVSLTDIKKEVAKIVKIPSEQVSTQDATFVEKLKDRLQAVVFGQDEAINKLEHVIKLSRSGLASENRPIGCFLFCGPTGVGKTELAKQLSTISQMAYLRFDMSEYMERHTVSRLIGAPPGYVGYAEGGLLTDAVHSNPSAVVLLDEIEKAHPDVHNILLQVMDHGSLTDSQGRETDFRHCVIIMTSNVGAKEMAKGTIGLDRNPQNDKDTIAVKEAFSPEFINRLDGVISFYNLAMETVVKIVEKFLNDVENKLAKKKIALQVSLEAKKLLASKGYSSAYGARPVARLIDEKIKKPLADLILSAQLKKGSAAKVECEDKEILIKIENSLDHKSAG